VDGILIDDPADPRVADYVGLRDAELRRPENGWFIAEGRLVVEQLVRSPYPVRSLLVTPSRFEALRRSVALDSVTAPVYLAEPAVLKAVAGFDLHRGVLASGARLPAADPAAVLAPVRATSGVVAILEGVNDHENLGALFRNAAAFGVGAVLLDPTCCDPLYRRSVRVSMGHVLHVPFARVSPWPDSLDVLRRDGWRVLALTPDPMARPLAARPDGRPVALLLGGEGTGLTPAALAVADASVRIPMAPGVDSLNVATAAAVAFHHLLLAGRGD
jgi:tRNA G18 (ribose-2'-O)-methylase SpoU